jgi:hypothetical protein
MAEGATSADLEDASIGDDRAAKIAEELGKHATVEVLYLGSNQIGVAGAARLAGALRENTTLKMLDLRDN